MSSLASPARPSLPALLAAGLARIARGVAHGHAQLLAARDVVEAVRDQRRPDPAALDILGLRGIADR